MELRVLLKALEEELGKQLLVRGTKGSRKVTLTEEGMILRKRAEEILTLVNKAEEEIAHSDDTVVGTVSIGAGETDIVRYFAKAARTLQKRYPDIRYQISSGNAEYVLEYLDKGLIDFGLVFGEVDQRKYQSLPLPAKDTWGVLMRRDSPLAEKEAITPWWPPTTWCTTPPCWWTRAWAMPSPWTSSSTQRAQTCASGPSPLGWRPPPPLCGRSTRCSPRRRTPSCGA